jgi:hypothetical protein
MGAREGERNRADLRGSRGTENFGETGGGTGALRWSRDGNGRQRERYEQHQRRQGFIDPAALARSALPVSVRLPLIPTAVRTGTCAGDLVAPLGDRGDADLDAEQQKEQDQ